MEEYRGCNRYIQYKTEAIACSPAYCGKLFEGICSSSLERNEQDQSDIALSIFGKTVPDHLLPCQVLRYIHKAIHATTAREVLHHPAASNLRDARARTARLYVEEVCEEAADLKVLEGVVW
jgi:hypothetical protein